MSIESKRSVTPQGGERDNDCRRVEPLLDDLVDGRLSAAELRLAESHVATCGPCAERLASLRDLLAQVEALPRSLEPGADLWPGIEPRLVSRRRPAFAAGGWPHWLRQAAAAVAFMTLGGALSQIVMPSRRGEASAAVPGASLAAAGGGVDQGIASRAVDFAVAEADFLRAKEALWSAVYGGHDAVSPATREVVEHNLVVIAGAIRELRAALASDPGNHQLEGMLLAQHRTEIDLLQRLVGPPAVTEI